MPIIASKIIESENTTAIQSLKHARWHTQEDSKAAFNAYYMQFPVMAAGGVIAAGFAPADGMTETVQWAAAAGSATASAYLAQGVYELRGKLNYLRDRFTKASHGFHHFEQRLTQGLADTLHEPHDSPKSALSIKKHPVRLGLTALFAAAATLPETFMGQAAFGFMAAQAFFGSLLLKEEQDIEAVHDAATTAKERLELIRELRLKQPELLEGFDFR